MRTETVNIYKFDELTPEAQENAINKYRYEDHGQGQHDYQEIIDTIKKVVELFNLKTGRTYSDIRTGHIDDDILNLKGTRLYKYLVNHYWSELFKPAYIKHIDRKFYSRAFICKVRKDYKGNDYTQIYSRNRTSNSCVLTGVCWDENILQPVYEFLKNPDANTTFEDLMKDIENAISKTFRETEDWINSDEYIKEELQANDREFTEDGNLY